MNPITFVGRDLSDLIRRAALTGRGIPQRGIRIKGVWRIEYAA